MKKIKAIEKIYSKDFGEKDITKVISYLKSIGYDSLADLLSPSTFNRTV